MAEKLNSSEIDKLRALVGMGAGVPEQERTPSPVPKEPAFLRPPPLNERVERMPSAPPVEEKEDVAPSEPSAVFDTELFVKIDEHAAIGEVLGSTKGNMKAIADIVSLLAKAEKLKSEAIERMAITLTDIDGQIHTIESKIAAPEGLSISEFGGAAGVASDLIDLRSELESLKGELGMMKK